MDYQPLTAATLPARLGGLPALARIGPPTAWDVSEIGDGNLNLVFVVSGPGGQAIVKQALPYVRLVGEGWPLPLTRSFFEYHALIRHAARDPGSVPAVRHFDEGQALIVMDYLADHVILRTALVEGQRVAGLGRRLGTFCARTLFRGSDLSMTAADRKADLALFAGNAALCDITENLVFSDPYFEAPLNRHTPGLEAAVARLRADTAVKLAAQHLKTAFATRAETLLHGDLHTGSVMVTADAAVVIDPEFATYGPMGFDVGMLISNLLMSHLSQPGHETRPGDRAAQQAWLLEEVRALWAAFAAEFAHLWRTERTGMLYAASVLSAAEAERALADVLARIWRDACGVMGVEMHRRILGLAHNADFERIADPARRAACEARALALGRDLMLGGGTDIADVAATAARINAEDHL